MASKKRNTAHTKNNKPDYLQIAAIQSKTGNLWMQRAACKGKTNLMFPKEHKDITYIAEARALCRTCPVKTPCLAYALQYPMADIHGVWAGLTSRQLAAKQKELGIKPTKPTLAQLWGE
jgi:WhiB family redox-sensing transcriptional regulator